MSWFNRKMKKRYGRCERATSSTLGSTVNSQYESADTNRLNEKHYQAAVLADADASQFIVRGTLRNRSRFEANNNSYFVGVMDTYASDLVGKGVRLTLQTENEDFNREVEEAFSKWRARCDISGRLDLDGFLKLSTTEYFRSGESFLQIVNDPAESAKVKLKLLVIEADRVQSPDALLLQTEAEREGIKIDPATGRVISYMVLKTHPGSNRSFTTFQLSDFNEVRAEDMIHDYEQNRPGQTRGIPWLSSSLDLFSQLRDFTWATLISAHTAARFSAVIQTTSDDIQTDEVPAEQRFVEEIETGSMASLPAGWELSQFKPEHPIANFREFRRELLGESGRPVGMPFFILAASSEGINFAGSKMDGQIYTRHIRGTRKCKESRILNRLLDLFVTESILSGAIKRPAGISIQARDIPRQWGWDRVMVHADPQKEAKAKQILLENGTDTFISQCAEEGIDWRKKLQEVADADAFAKDLGVTIGRPKQQSIGFGGAPDVESDEQETEEEVSAAAAS